MNTKTCNYFQEVEALYDGRLDGAKRGSLEQHIASCLNCKAELAQLAKTTQALRDLPAANLDELALRRRRQQLLLAAQPLRASRRLRVLGAFAAAVVGCALAAGFILGSDAPQKSAQSVASSMAAPQLEVEIVASGTTRWSRRQDGIIERVELLEGELALEVRGNGGQRRLVVAVPGGIIEDIGTRFVVNVQAGSVRRIAVSEGAVVFHRSAGLGAVRISAPSTWTAQDIHPSASVSPAASSHSSPVPPASATAHNKHVVKAVAPSAQSSAPGAEAPGLGDALALIRAGRHAAAAAQLQAFLAAHPADARAEDAAYLLVVASARSGAKAQAAAAAREYLERYPNGFRRLEVEGLLRE